MTAAWTTDRIVAVLATRNALSAVAGRPCPVAARIVTDLTTYIRTGA